MRGSIRQARSTMTASCMEQATAISGKKRSMAQARMYSAPAASKSGRLSAWEGTAWRTSAGIEVPSCLEHVDDPCRGLLWPLALGRDLDLVLDGRLVGVVDAGEP